VQMTQRCENVVTTDERDGVGVGLILGPALRRDRGSPGEQRDDDRERKATPLDVVRTVMQRTGDERDCDGPQDNRRDQGHWPASSTPLDQVGYLVGHGSALHCLGLVEDSGMDSDALVSAPD
jgi:hypothetical protein